MGNLILHMILQLIHQIIYLCLILNSTQSTLASNPAKRVILYDYSGGNTYEEMRVITIINGTSYRIGLFGEP
jgi:hypothetical protein